MLSGIVLLGPRLRAAGRSSARAWRQTEVTFRELDRTTLEAYLASGEWRDRAGAYAIQGLGSILVERVEGDFSNVVGLPVTAAAGAGARAARARPRPRARAEPNP